MCEVLGQVRVNAEENRLMIFLIILLCLGVASARKEPAAGSCEKNLLETCLHPHSCLIMREKTPPVFDVTFKTSKGSFTLRTVTAWAPPFARRWWQISKLRYMKVRKKCPSCRVPAILHAPVVPFTHPVV